MINTPIRLLFIISLVATAGAETPNALNHFKVREAAMRMHARFFGPYCKETAKIYFIKGDIAISHARDFISNLKDGKPIMSEEELKEKYREACSKVYSKQFKCREDDPEFVKFCSQEADEFVIIVLTLLQRELNRK